MYRITTTFLAVIISPLLITIASTSISFISLFLSVESFAGSQSIQWHEFIPEGCDITRIAHVPDSSDTLYVSTRHAGLFKTTDGGATWQKISKDFTDSFVWTVTVDPTNPKTVYAGTDRSGIYVSEDGGKIWRTKNNGLPQGYRIDFVKFTTGIRDLFCIAAGLVYKFNKPHQQWDKLSSGLPSDAGITNFVLHPTNPDIMYVSTFGYGMYKSSDGAQSWKKLEKAPSSSPGWGLDIDPMSPDTLYLGLGGSEGMYKTTDGGASWAAISSGLENNASKVVKSVKVDPLHPASVFIGTQWGFYHSGNGGKHWSKATKGPGFGPYDPGGAETIEFKYNSGATLYSGNLSKGVFKSMDGGATWTSLAAEMCVPYIRKICTDKTDPNSLLAASIDGIYVTYDGGKKWSNTTKGIPEPDRNMQTLVRHPHNSETYYAGAAKGLYTTTDNGRTWQRFDSSLEYDWARDFYIDPDRPQHLMIASYGIYESMNGGKNWQRLTSKEMGDKSIKFIRADERGEIYYAGTTTDGLYRSVDNGKSWENVGDVFKGEKDVADLAIHVDRPGVVYVGVSRKGMFKSTDSGESWQSINNGFKGPVISIQSILIHPQNPAILYAGANTGVYKSTDEGLSWSRLGTIYEGASIQSLSFTQSSPPRLYAATGGGIFWVEQP